MPDRSRLNTPTQPGLARPRARGAVRLGVVAAALVAAAAARMTTAQDDDPRKYLDRLNAPILAVSEDERAYKIYFQAHELIDVSDARFSAATQALDPFSPTFKDAIEWVGEPDQQEAVKLILEKNQRGSNATQRKVFGLPYGTYNVDDDLVISDFVVYLRDNMLFDREESYLPQYRELMALLRAEAFRRAENGETSGACDAILGMTRMARQLCDQRFYSEKHLGMNLVLDSFLEIRDFMWFYRDKLTLDDYKMIAVELERLGLERIELPSGEELIGEQLIEQVYLPSNLVDKDRFTQVMATLDSLGSPLKRFQAQAYWRQVADDHRTRREVETALKEAVANWKLRWRLPLHSSLSPDSEFEQLDDLEYAAVKRPIRDLQNLFELRIPLVTQLNGTATAAGVHAYIVRERGKLVPGQPLNEADVPAKLAQIQPSFVTYESTLVDTYDSADTKLHYAVIRNTDPRFKHDGYPVRTPEGTIKLDEFWPLLYSVGPDKSEDIRSEFVHDPAPAQGEKCDIIFFPNVDLIAREARRRP